MTIDPSFRSVALLSTDKTLAVTFESSEILSPIFASTNLAPEASMLFK